MARNQNFYDNADSRTYRFPAATLSAAAVVGRFQGPAGKVGRVRGIEYMTTTGITVAASLVTVGVNGAVAPASISIPVTAINLGGAMSDDEVKAAGAEEVAGTNDVELTADTTIEVASDGGSTAGAADLIIKVDWF
jgi:hypothetical protein